MRPALQKAPRPAKRLFGEPIALVSLVDSDRQWFKSCVGLGASQTPRDVSFCGHAILGDGIFPAPDALEDKRFHDNPLVTGDPNVRFSAGCPLKVANGSRLGTLCLIDVKPRDLDEDDRALLCDLAKMAEQELAAVQLATMDDLTLRPNRRGYDMRFGVGQVEIDVQRQDKIGVAVAEADAAMYAHEQASRADAAVPV